MGGKWPEGRTKALMRSWHAVVLLVITTLLVGCGGSDTSAVLGDADATAGDPVNSETLVRFDAKLEFLRQALRIPGLSAAVVKNQELLWAQGFGYADSENRIEATTGTPYGLASVTKPFAAILLMKLFEDGRLDLDTPIVEFGIDLGNDAITVRHLLSHTSEGVPGSHYQYSGDRYSRLTTVIERFYGDSFRRALRQEILDPLGMDDTALNVGGCGVAYYLSALGPDDLERAFEHVYRELAVPYQVDLDYEVYPVSVPTYANAAAGLISTVVDLARFAAAIERDELVASETKQLIFTPTKLNSGADGPYGLGWFTETVADTRLVWHYGYGAYSSLFLMVPEQGLTFIVLANTQNLSRPFRLGAADGSVLASPFALAFYKEFVLSPRLSDPLPAIDWTADTDAVVEQLAQVTDPKLRELYEGELWTYRKLYAGVGRRDLTSQLLAAHRRAFPDAKRTAGDLYQVGAPAARPTEIERIELSEAEASRWIGRYTLRAADEAIDLPLEVEVRMVEGRVLAVPRNDECQELLPQTPLRLRSASNLDLYLVGEGETGPFPTVAVEYHGQVIPAYERVK